MRHRAALAPLLLLAACEGNQSALLAAGPQAGHIERLWWLYLTILLGVFALVIVALFAALLRSRRAHGEEQIPEIDPASLPDVPRQPVHAINVEKETRFEHRIWGLVALSSVLLIVLLVSSIATGHALGVFSQKPALTIKVTGHQWWWEFQYEDSTAANVVTTANEVHIPVGQPVRFELASGDVIHSFWVPELHGKRDAIPGWSSSTTLQADKPGIYRGQCAEFCGHQHAKMALVVVADPPDVFQKWLQAQRAPAPPPTTEAQRRGQQVFERGPCSMCHTIRGTEVPTFGNVAPDLTHLKSRSTIAAGTLPNSRGNLAGWIIDSQSIKPGNHMPAIGLQPQELQDLLEYLETLQ